MCLLPSFCERIGCYILREALDYSKRSRKEGIWSTVDPRKDVSLHCVGFPKVSSYIDNLTCFKVVWFICWVSPGTGLPLVAPSQCAVLLLLASSGSGSNQPANQPASQSCLPIPSSSSCSLSHRWKTFCSKTPQHKLSQTHTSLFLFALIKTNSGNHSPSKCKILLYLRPPPYPAPAPTLHVQHQQLLARQGSSPTAPSAPSAR